MIASDLALLRKYQQENSEEAFAELVNRHLNLVYSAALRQTRSHQLAEEIAQSAFTDLARNANRLAPDTILTAWLYQVTRRTAIDVVRRETRRQLREQIATEMNAMNATAADWTHIEPLLDEAMDALDDTDRAAVLLRFFENKSLREVGTALGTSDDAAQKRVSRAVERLREFLAKRGVTVGAAGIAAVISANAVQSAPAGLGVTISAAALTGTTLATSATTTIAKAIAMTTLQKTLAASAILGLIGTGIYEANQAAQLKNQLHAVQQQQAPLLETIERLSRDHDSLTNRLALLLAENERVKKSSAEVLKLRGEVGMLRNNLQNSTQAAGDPFVQQALVWKAKKDKLRQLLEERPDQKIPELNLLDDQTFLDVARGADLESEDGIRAALGNLRNIAGNVLAGKLQPALQQFAQANAEQPPQNMAELASYFDPPVDSGILERYRILNTGTNVVAGWSGGWVISQKNAVDRNYDRRWLISPVGFSSTDF